MDNQFKIIEEEPKTEESPILPNLKNVETKKEELVTTVPDWSIEPPVEINRGQNDIR